MVVDVGGFLPQVCVAALLAVMTCRGYRSSRDQGSVGPHRQGRPIPQGRRRCRQLQPAGRGGWAGRGEYPHG